MAMFKVGDFVIKDQQLFEIVGKQQNGYYYYLSDSTRFRRDVLRRYEVIPKEKVTKAMKILYKRS